GPVVQQQPAEGVEQGDVAAGSDGQIDVRLAGGRRPPRVDDGEQQVWVLLAGGADAGEDDRVGFGRVAADDQDDVGVVDVFITGRRAVAAEAGAIPGDGGGHAQTTVAVRVVGAEGALEQFARQVGRFGVELAAAVEGDGVGAV